MVAPDLRKKILELAEQANYVPDPAAQLMRKPRVHLITVLLPRETGAFMSEYYGVVLSGIISAAREGTTIQAESTPIHIGKKTCVWQTKITREDGKLVAIVTQTQMVLLP